MRKQNVSTSLATTCFIAGCSFDTSTKSNCAALLAVRLCGSPSLLTSTASNARSFSGRLLRSSNAAFTLFSFSTGNGSLDKASSALTKRAYARFTRSSTCQYRSLLRSFGASPDAARGCSEKYLSFRFGGNKASRKSSVSAPTAWTAPRFPPLTRAFSRSARRCSSDRRFATGSSCASTVAAAILSAAVPEVRTSDSHLESALPERALCFSWCAVRSSSALIATLSLASMSFWGSSLAFFTAFEGRAKESDASCHTLLSRWFSPSPPPPPPSRSGLGPAPGFHARPRLGGRSPGRSARFFSSGAFFFPLEDLPPAPPSTPPPPAIVSRRGGISGHRKRRALALFRARAERDR